MSRAHAANVAGRHRERERRKAKGPRLRHAYACLVMALLLTGCGPTPFEAGTERMVEGLAAGETVDLARLVPGTAWDRVCVIGPYQGRDAASATVGFEWPRSRTGLELLDNIALLVFVDGERIAGEVDVQRLPVDFADLEGQCAPRSAAVFAPSLDARTRWRTAVFAGPAPP